jgi:hypothetical protein
VPFGNKFKKLSELTTLLTNAVRAVTGLPLITPEIRGVAPVTVTPVAETSRPAVKSLTATFTVDPLWTIGNTSVPASGVVALVSAEIFWSAMFMLH